MNIVNFKIADKFYNKNNLIESFINTHIYTIESSGYHEKRDLFKTTDDILFFLDSLLKNDSENKLDSFVIKIEAEKYNDVELGKQRKFLEGVYQNTYYVKINFLKVLYDSIVSKLLNTNEGHTEYDQTFKDILLKMDNLVKFSKYNNIPIGSHKVYTAEDELKEGRELDATLNNPLLENNYNLVQADIAYLIEKALNIININGSLKEFVKNERVLNYVVENNNFILLERIMKYELDINQESNNSIPLEYANTTKMLKTLDKYGADFEYKSRNNNQVVVNLNNKKVEDDFIVYLMNKSKDLGLDDIRNRILNMVNDGYTKKAVENGIKVLMEQRDFDLNDIKNEKGQNILMIFLDKRDISKALMFKDEINIFNKDDYGIATIAYMGRAGFESRKQSFLNSSYNLMHEKVDEYLDKLKKGQTDESLSYHLILNLLIKKQQTTDMLMMFQIYYDKLKLNKEKPYNRLNTLYNWPNENLNVLKSLWASGEENKVYFKNVLNYAFDMLDEEMKINKDLKAKPLDISQLYIDDYFVDGYKRVDVSEKMNNLFSFIKGYQEKINGMEDYIKMQELMVNIFNDKTLILKNKKNVCVTENNLRSVLSLFSNFEAEQVRKLDLTATIGHIDKNKELLSMHNNLTMKGLLVEKKEDKKRKI